jgi:hypothetical protein
VRQRIEFWMVIICVAVCFTAPVAAFFAVAAGSTRFTIWNADGSSTRFDLRDPDHVSRRGYGPTIDSNTDFVWPRLIALFAMPPLMLWSLERRAATPKSRAQRRLQLCCAACPMALSLARFFLQPEVGIFCFLPLALIAAFIWGIGALISSYRSPAERRLAKGLCPQCGYDIRATPARCPECGSFIPVTIRRVTP